MTIIPPVDFGHIEDPELRQWLEARPADWQQENRDRNPHALLREMVDGMVAESIATAYRPSADSVDVGAMSVDEFVAYINKKVGYTGE